MPYIYKSGLTFGRTLANRLDSLMARVERHKAAAILIDGGLGEGKTTLLIHILNYINKKNGLPPLDLSDKDNSQIAMGGADFLKKIRISYQKKLPCVGYDEAGDFSRRGALTSFNAVLNRTFETFRAFRSIVVIVLPNFNSLDGKIFENKIPRLLLHLNNRKVAYGNYTGYGLYRINLLRAKMRKFQLKEFAYTVVWPNFYGHFLDLPPEECKKLDKLSTSNKLDILTKGEIDIDHLVSYLDICHKVGRSLCFVRSMLREMKLPPDRIIKKVKYFKADVINIVSDRIDQRTETSAAKRKERKAEARNK